VIRVFMIAASPASQAGLEKLRQLKAAKLSGRATGLDAAGAQLAETEADVILVDATGERPGDLSDSLIESDLASDLPMVVLADDLPADAYRALLHAGVRGVLPRSASSDQLFSALEAAVSGLVVLPPEQAQMVAARTGGSPPPADEFTESLTPREHDVLQMLAAGLANKEIALRLAISEHTAKFHVASILAKLGAESRTEAVSLAIRRGLVLL